MTQDTPFDLPTAHGKIGRRIQTLIAFSGVPKGTTGRVTRADPSPDGYTLGIQWDLPGRARPLVDWFSRSEYERFLVEM